MRLRQLERTLVALGVYAVRLLKNCVMLMEELVQEHPHSAMYCVPVIDTILEVCPRERTQLYAKQMQAIVSQAMPSPDTAMVYNKTASLA